MIINKKKLLQLYQYAFEAERVAFKPILELVGSPEFEADERDGIEPINIYHELFENWGLKYAKRESLEDVLTVLNINFDKIKHENILNYTNEV